MRLWKFFGYTLIFFILICLVLGMLFIVDLCNNGRNHIMICQAKFLIKMSPLSSLLCLE